MGQKSMIDRVIKIIALLTFALVLAAQNGVVEGTVFNRVTGLAVPGVAVKLASAATPHKILYKAESDVAGAFRIEGLSDGDYVATFGVPAGFLAPSRQDRSCRTFHVEGNGPAAQLRVPIQPSVTLRVRVTDGEGHPVPNVRVECFLAVGGGGATGSTDSDGRILVDGLAAGAYKLRARPVLAGTPLARRYKQLSTLSEKLPESERWSWVPTYFPSAIDIAGAETVVLNEGTVPPEYSIRLRAIPVYRLRGTVLDDAGKPVSGAAVRILSEIGWGTAEALTTSNSDGSFEFSSVRAGEWQIGAEIKRDNVALEGLAQVTMPQRDLDDVRLRLSPPFSLDATVEGLPPELGDPPVFLVAVDHPEGGLADARRRPDGTYRFENLYPGRYQAMQWRPLTGYYLKSVLLGSRDMTGKDVNLTPEPTRLGLVFAANPAGVRGTVANGAGVRVVLVDTTEDSYILGQDIRIADCDERGQFAVEGLRPATYYVLAFAIGAVSHGAMREAVFRLGLSQQAQTVHLREGELVQLNLKVTEFPAALRRP